MELLTQSEIVDCITTPATNYPSSSTNAPGVLGSRYVQVTDILLLSLAVMLSQEWYCPLKSLLAVQLSIRTLLICCGCWSAWALSLRASMLYEYPQQLRSRRLYVQLFVGTLVCTGVLALGFAVVTTSPYHQRALAVFLVSSILLLMFSRAVFALAAIHVYPHLRRRRRVTIVGTGRRARELAVTGVWQVSGRSNTSFAGWVLLDLHYIDHWSLTMDMRILLRTIPTVVRGIGAV